MRGLGSMGGRNVLVLGGAGLAASTLAAMVMALEPEIIPSRRVWRDKANWKPTKAPPFRPVGSKRQGRRRR